VKRAIGLGPLVALFGLFSAWLLTGSAGRAAEPAAGTLDPAAVTIRVGIQPYADDGILKGAERERFRQLCEEIATNAREKYRCPIRLRLAAGSYADVFYWCEHEMIDMAVVTAGVYSLLEEHLGDRWTYLCTMGQGAQHDRFEYGVECFTHRDAAQPGLDEIRTALHAGLLDVFLVDPKSVSGGVFPLAFLKGQNIPAYDKRALERKGSPVSHVIYTGSHEDCLKTVSRTGETRDGRQRIGFVWDGALQKAVAAGAPVRRVPLAGLAEIRIPESAVVVRTSFYQQNQALLDKLPTRPDFTRLPAYEEKYDRIRRWREEFAPEPPTASERTDWPNFFRQLEAYMREQKQSPRIALVLAGGGAKCAFQVGVIRAIETELRRYREQDFPRFVQESRLNLQPLDIALVVGTSGGAINALPAALGTYSSDAGIATLRSVWQSLDARDILQPELAVRLSVGALVFLIELVLVLLLVRLRFRGRPLVARERRGRLVATICLLLGAVQVLWTLSGWKVPWDALYYVDSGLFVVWAVAASGTAIVGLLMLIAAVLVGGLDLRLRLRGSFLAMSPSAARETIAWLTLVIIVSAAPIALQAASYISQVHGLEGRIADAAERLVNERLTSGGRKPIRTRDLAALGRAVLDNGLLERDLIITATILPEQGDDASDTDVYFYASAGQTNAQTVRRMREDSRVQYLNEPSRRGALLHAVMGSGAVFPVFPARSIINYPTAGHTLQLVDGSFCHHNPIEAAALWGATHVIVVNPSPTVRETTGPNQRTLYENSQVALQRLFEQAQNVDRRAERDLTVFFINPDADKHNISLLSFARKPIEDAIDHAQGELDKKQKPFRRRLSKPLFLPDLDTLKTASADAGGSRRE
jgi:predicted acylesterase/phospholipase RssA